MKKNFCLVLFLCLFLFVSCSVQTVSSDRICFGTYCKATLYGKVKNSEQIFEGLWQKMTELENTISSKLEYSLVSQINNGQTDIQNSDIELLIETALKFEELTDGAFSVYLGAVSDLWGIGTEDAKVPSSEEIEQALQVKKLDFGALGKGYATDLAKQYLIDCGVKSAVLDFGGNICCLGNKNGKPFIISIQDPDKQRGIAATSLEIEDKCVVTSGSYERYFEENGVRYCHILDGRTGYPVQGELKSVTIIGPSGLICDALSTCCYILGREEALRLIEQFSDYNVLFLP